MRTLILYFGLAAAGYLIGKRKKVKSVLTSRIQTAALYTLVGVMGLRMGMNEEIIGQIGSIGITAFVFTVVVMAFSALFVRISRLALNIDRYAVPGGNGDPAASTRAAGEEASQESGDESRKTTIAILFFLALGMTSGVLLSNLTAISGTGFEGSLIDSVTGDIITLGLCTLLMMVGIDMGAEGSMLENLRKAGLRVFVTPVAVILGTFAGSLLMSLFLPISAKECLAVGAGFGWYSLAPGILMENGFALAGAISFLHNVMREVFSIAAIPFVAEKIGYIECVSLPGACAGDVCLPVVQRSAGSRTAIYSVFSGGTLSIAVPLLVTMIVSL